MRKTICFGVYIFGLVLSINAIGQTKVPICDRPPIQWMDMDTTNCRNYADTVGNINWLRCIDSIKDRFYEQFSDNKALVYYQYEKDHSHFLCYALGYRATLIYFFSDERIASIQQYDSCTVSEVDFDGEGHLTKKYFCDYSRPDSCYEKIYNHGVIESETDYEPFSHSGRTDLDSLNVYCQTYKKVPVMKIQYDMKGNKSSVSKIVPPAYYKRITGW